MDNVTLDQQRIWREEYLQHRRVPSTLAENMSKTLIEFLHEIPIEPGSKFLDSGSGNGRNSIQLGLLGYEATGVEFVPEKVQSSLEKAQELELTDRVTFLNQSISEKFPMPDGSYDVVIDMTTMHALRRPERQRYYSEVFRLLKPGGYFVFYAIGEGGAADKLLEQSPADEESSYYMPESGAFEKVFTEETLDHELIKEAKLMKVKLEKQFRQTKWGDEVYDRYYYYGIYKKVI